MSRLAIVLMVLLAQLVLATLVLSVMVLDERPHPGPAPALTVADLERLRRQVGVPDPRRPSVSAVPLTLHPRDIDLLLQQGLQRALPDHGIGARVSLEHGAAWLRVSLRVPAGPLGKATTVGLRLESREGQLQAVAGSIGRVPINRWVLDHLWSLGQRFVLSPQALTALRAALAATSGWEIGRDLVNLRIQPQAELLGQLRGAGGSGGVLGAEQRARVDHYLAHIAARLGAAAGPGLVTVLQSVIGEAAARGGDARAENRAAMLALAVHASEKPELAARLLGISVPPGKPVIPVARGRQDLAQHWLVSAAITLEAGSGTADAIGVFKEVLDSRGGSGFSFADLAADRSGVRFAQAAIADPRRWQARVARIAGEADIIPAIDALPEKLQEPSFQRRFKARDNQAWAEMTAEIERRIDLCRFFAAPG
ncbi:MAG: hypothetical protein KGQ67_14890 [Betaproteobacteria bacterium]|nr:hypothetical protein [Betaproteobacteria bacterium]